MKKMKLAVLALVGVLAAGNAMAGDSTQVNVSATVLGTCSFDAPSYNMAFGNINTTDSGDKTATATLKFTCTNNTSYTIANVAGNRNMSATLADNSTENLPYSIAAYTTNAVADGTLTDVVLTGTIEDTAYQVASAATYTETLIINITP